MEAEASLTHVIEISPKPEDGGTFKVYISILMPGNLDEPTPRLLFSLQNNQSFSDCESGLRELKDLLNEAGLTNRHANYAHSQFTSHLSNLFSPRRYTADASSVYLHVKVTHPQIHEVIQASFNEATNNIRCIPASKVVVGSLSRKVYNTEDKVHSADSMRCAICLEEFKNGQRLVILPCGHGFDEKCIVDWFETSHVCPLCRFELPCEEMN